MASIDHPDPPGCMLGWHEDSDDIFGDPGPALAQREERLRKKFACYRLFRQWNGTGGEWKKLDELVRQGKLVLISHKGPKFDGDFDPVHGLRSWQYIAEGKADTYVIDSLIPKYRDLPREVVFIFHHEPHAAATEEGGAHGDGKDFVGAWIRLHQLFVEHRAHHSVGGPVAFGYCATMRQAENIEQDFCYPGDPYVDLFCHDRYNYGTNGGRNTWELFGEGDGALFGPFIRNVCEPRQKRLLIGEIASGEITGQSRNEWFRNMANFIKSDPYARKWVIGFNYFHSIHTDPKGITNDWRILGDDNEPVGSEGAEGWIQSFSDDPFFLEAPISLRT
jgi:hypothetical protein